MKKFLLTLLLFAFVAGATAQKKRHHKSKFRKKLKKTTWIVGLSGTVIDDDAKQFKDLFNVKDSWDFLYFPSKLNLEALFKHGLTVEAALTASQLKKGKITSEENNIRLTNAALVAFDMDVKFDLNEATGHSWFIGPYAIGGLGYTYRGLLERKSAITANFGFGLNFWIANGIGLNVQSMAKFALNNASGKNYLQHSAGIVYRFNLLKGSIVKDRRNQRYNLFKM